MTCERDVVPREDRWGVTGVGERDEVPRGDCGMKVTPIGIIPVF